MVMVVLAEHTVTASTTSGTWTDHWTLHSQYSQFSQPLTHSLARCLASLHTQTARTAGWLYQFWSQQHTGKAQHRHLAACVPVAMHHQSSSGSDNNNTGVRCCTLLTTHQVESPRSCGCCCTQREGNKQLWWRQVEQTCHKRALAIGRQKLSHCYRPVCSIYDDNLHSFIVCCASCLHYNANLPLEP